MPNRSSHAGHVPERTCVICRKKLDKANLLRLVVLDRNLYIDMTGKLSRRGYYVCDDNQCLEQLEKWHRKKMRRSLGRQTKSGDKGK